MAQGQHFWYVLCCPCTSAIIDGGFFFKTPNFIGPRVGSMIFEGRLSDELLIDQASDGCCTLASTDVGTSDCRFFTLAIIDTWYDGTRDFAVLPWQRLGMGMWRFSRVFLGSLSYSKLFITCRLSRRVGRLLGILRFQKLGDGYVPGAWHKTLLMNDMCKRSTFFVFVCFSVSKMFVYWRSQSGEIFQGTSKGALFFSFVNKFISKFVFHSVQGALQCQFLFRFASKQSRFFHFFLCFYIICEYLHADCH